ncbi:carbon-nitrogen hydrolase family protein [uncultured Fibrella sp.]|uniref:carbon-nitrogen hydrolase family protein n=1 Tax=uncultured Fibrella sp. TaxID=1284596 RepID=UPI0035CAD1CD
MTICVAQTEALAGDISANIQRHTFYINQAVAEGANLIIFPELSITGYEPTLAADLATELDDARFNVFQQLSDASQIVIGVGAPIKQGTGIWIGLILFQPQQERRLYAKHYLHPDEEPFFVSGESFASLSVANQQVAFAICYELFVPEHTTAACSCGAGVYIASVAKSVGGIDKALDTLATKARDQSMTVLMANCIGMADGQECAGRSSIWNDKGALLGQLDTSSEGVLLIDTNTQQVVTRQ